ncbi:MAG: shufflon system plasmid conjugative transfer pilus tip adhesin PilV, partial [Candidatus Jorgensenbacteria bacterium]|nr:shufflon system plasmid conjugative transfer pilus tip adhesin PilV [Candidatus Jorgensenbacteria bacterium]
NRLRFSLFVLFIFISAFSFASPVVYAQSLTSIKFLPGTSAAACASGSAGLYYDSASASFKVCTNGGPSYSLDSASGASLVAGSNMTLVGSSGATRNGSGGWDAQVYSKDGFPGGAYTSAVVQSLSYSYMFGLNTDPTTDASYCSIDYAWYITAGTNGYIYESCGNPATGITLAAGDVLAVTYDGANVRYLQNGVVRRTVAATITNPLYFDSSFTAGGNTATISNIQVGPIANVTGATDSTKVLKAGDTMTGSLTMSAGNIVVGAAGSVYAPNYYYVSDNAYGFVGRDVYADTINSGVSGDTLEINYRRPGPTKICATAGCGTFSAWFGTDGNVGIGTTSPGYKLDVAGDIRAQSAWLRTTGSTGWFNETYSGGFYMQDVTWVRTYNDRSIWTGGGLLGSNGGLTVGYGGNGSPSGGAIIAGSVGIGTASPGAKLDINAGGLGRGGSGGVVITGTIDHLDPILKVYEANATGCAGCQRYGGKFSVTGAAPNSTNYGIYATAANAGTNWAGYFDGNVYVSGVITGNGSGLTNITATDSTKVLKAGDTMTGILNINAGDSSYTLYGPNASWAGKLYVGATPNKAVTQAAQVIATDGNLHLDPAPSKNIYIDYYQGRDIYINAGAGNVGIGNTSPAYKLDVTGDARVSGTMYQRGTYTVCDSGNNCGYLTSPAGTWWGISYFGSNKGASSYVGGNYAYGLEAFSNDGGAAGMSFHRGGYYALNMGLDPDNVLRIGGWSAASNLWQLDMSGNETASGSMRAPIFYDKDNTAFYLDPAGSSRLNQLYYVDQAYIVDVRPQYMYDWNDSAYYMDFNNTSRLNVLQTAGTITVGGGAGKIDVGTVDPPYTIDGKKYATYVPSMSGVKEEATGNVKCQVLGDKCSAVLDLKNSPEASDLWLFAKTTNLANEGLDNVTVLVSPNFDGRTWYEKKDGKIIVYAKQDTKSASKTLEISYRLTAPRFDHDSFGNRRADTDTTEGFNLDKLIK